jgi:5'-nucleotidase
MRVLVTNDDGIQAPGLTVLVDAAQSNGWEVVVVAPSQQRSGTSRSFYSDSIVGLREVYSHSCRSYTTESTPAACVLAALGSTVGGNFDLCLSGVNSGENLGAGLTISGTFGAAVEAAIHGIKSVAVSIECGDPADEPDKWQWERVAVRLPSLLKQLVGAVPEITPFVLANVNLAWYGLAEDVVYCDVSQESYLSDVYDDASDSIRSARGYRVNGLKPQDDILWFAERHRNTATLFANGPFTPIPITR